MISAPDWRVVSVIGSLPETLSAKLNNYGWMLQETQDLRRIYSRAKVGIINMSNINVSIEALDRTLYQYSDTKWLCLLEKEQLKNNTLRNMVCRHCSDFITIPFDDNWLSYSMGHLWGIQSLKVPQKNIEPEQKLPAFLPDNSNVSSRIFNNLKKISLLESNVYVTAHEGACFNEIIHFIHESSWRQNSEVIRLNPKNISALSLNEKLSNLEESRVDVTVVIEDIDYLSKGEGEAVTDYFKRKKMQRLSESQSNLRFIFSSASENVELVNAALLEESNPIMFRMPTLSCFGDALLNLIEKRLYFISKRLMMAKPVFSEALKEELVQYSWPGDYKELDQVLTHAVLSNSGKVIHSVGLDVENINNERVSISNLREKNESDAVLAAIKASKGCISQSCELLKISRASIYRLIKKHQLSDALAQARRR